MKEIKYTNNISGGYIKDLAIISFVGALIKISKEPDNIPDYDPNNNGIIDAGFVFKSDEEEQMISDMLNSIYDEVWAIMSHPDNNNIKNKVKTNINKLMSKSMRILTSQNIALDTLAMYVLWNNFIKRTAPMHRNFKSIIDMEYNLTTIMDTFDVAGQKLITKIQMNNIAKEVIAEVK